MEPLTALSLANSIVQFIDFGAKLIGAANQIRRSSSGLTNSDQSLNAVVGEMREISLKYSSEELKLETAEEKALGRLAKECQEVLEQILNMMELLTPQNLNAKWQSVWAAWKSWRRADEKAALEKTFDNCRKQFELQLSDLLSSKMKSRLIEV